MSAGYVKVAETSEVPAGNMKKVEVEGTQILIANVNGNYYAISNKCSLMGNALTQALGARHIIDRQIGKESHKA